VEHPAGERFEVSPIEASVFHRRRQARFVTADDQVEEPPAPPAPIEAKEAIVKTRRPRRRRRDISTSPHTKADA
jgi:hypothetical protein